MPKAKKSNRQAPAVTEDEALALVTRLDQITANFIGQFDELEAAIGMYMVGRLVGWKVLVLLHNKRTIKKYETILGGINIRDEFKPVTEFSSKSMAFDIVTKLGNFWKGVNGEYDNEELRQKRRELAL
ncbi:MAG: hypothetical protein M0Q22_04475 [Sulfuritalea sp.]|jgi:hypothetical protein|nr:hypothetical protein [Sulfuritalea sp.]